MKITRRTQLLVVALALCFTTMIGSTFAWFTDTVESTGNKIEAGTLKLEVLYQDGNKWKDLEQNPAPLFNYNLWEPGYAVVKGIEIKNTGTLALKYKVNFELTAESTGNYKLEDVIDVYLFNQEPARSDFGASAKVGTLTDLLYKEDVDGTVHGKLAGGATTDKLYIGLKMREEADNNYQGLSVGNGFNLVIVATQDTVESDSFGTDYDADATYPVIGQVDIYNAADFAKVKAGGIANLCADVTLSKDVTLPADTVLRGNGYLISSTDPTSNDGYVLADGNLTIDGHVKVEKFSASYYNRVITIGEDACLEITGGGRVSLAYGNTFNITGKLDNAKTADKSTIQPSLIIPGGISITGGSDATMNIMNAYVQIGSTSSKNNAANGNFTLNINNSIAEFTDQLTLAEPTNGMNPTFNINIKDSILTTGTKLCVAAPNSNVVIDNSTVVLGSYFRNSGNVMLKNGSGLTGSTIQFGENGGNNGTITVDNSTLTIDASSTGSAFDGKGTGNLVLKNGATASVTYYKDMEVGVDSTSTFTGTKVN